MKRALTLFALAWTMSAAAEPVEVALLADLAGRVEHRLTGTEAWRGASLDAPLFIDDGVRTHARSLAELRFVDGTLVAMDERTRLKISVTLFDVEQAPEAIRVALAEGSATVRAGRSRVNLVGADGTTRTLEPGDTATIGASGPAIGPSAQPPATPVVPALDPLGPSETGLDVGLLDPLDPELSLEPGFGWLDAAGDLLNPVAGPEAPPTGIRITIDVRGR